MSDDAGTTGPAEESRPRPRPRPSPKPSPEPEPAPEEAAEPEATPEPAPETESEPGPDAPESRMSRAERRKREVDGSRGSRLAARVVSVVSVLCVAAGVVVFVVARRHHDSSAASTPSTPSVVVDPRARLDDPAAAQGFVSAAVTEVVTVTESDYRRLDDTLQAGLTVTTGAFRTKFRTALTGTAAAQRVANKATTSVTVLKAGIGSVSDGGNQANVLVFAQVHQTGTNIPSGDQTVVSTLRLTLRKTGARYLISDLALGANAGVPPGTTGLATAAEAARKEVVAYLTSSRTAYTADLATAKAGAAGQLLTQISKNAPATLARMKAGSYDLTGAVTSIAAQQVSDDAAAFLVAASGTRVAANGAKTGDSDNHYSVVVQRSGTTWVASSITSVS